jgi:hypothetical protein
MLNNLMSSETKVFLKYNKSNIVDIDQKDETSDNES